MRLERQSTLTIKPHHMTSNTWSPVLNMSIMWHLMMALMDQHSAAAVNIQQEHLTWVSKNNSYCWTATYFYFKKWTCVWNWPSVHHLSVAGQSDIKDVSSTSSCVPGSVCYWSEWDISSSMSTSDHIPAQSCTSDSKIFCIKPGFNDICSDLTTTFTSGNCSPFRFTKNIPVGM